MATTVATNDRVSTPTLKHEAIIHWLLDNPTATNRQCAQHFKTTEAWMSTLTHSEIFQDKFEKFRDEFNGAAMATLQEKVHGLAHAAIDRLMEQVVESEDPGFVEKVADRTLNRLGYSSEQPKGVGLIINNNAMTVGTTSLESLQRAEALRHKAREEKQITGEVIPDAKNTQAQEMEEPRGDSVGGDLPTPKELAQTLESANRSPEGGLGLRAESL